MSETIPEKLKAGEEQDYAIRGGYRIFAKETGSGRPWCWYSPDLDLAKRLAGTIARELKQTVEICKYVGRVKPAETPVEWIEEGGDPKVAPMPQPPKDA